jgi:tRNA nucleotidyltransferase (CCA-adding enzyme)
MARFTEQTLTNWTKPPSDTEESKLENAERMVREAISEDDTLKSKSTETFGQGSYANNTNVKNNRVLSHLLKLSIKF